MEEKIILENKREYYKALLTSLENFDIDKEVEVRLSSERLKITEEVIKEVAKDSEKCKTYLELLESLIVEFDAINTVKNEENENPIQDHIDHTCDINSDMEA